MTTTPERDNPLSLSDFEDILAYIPHALGFHPSNSVVLMLIVGHRLEATLRVDLPAADLEQHDLNTWMLQVTNLLRRMPDVHSVISVFFVSDDESKQAATPRQDLHARLVEHLDRVGIDLKHAWCVNSSTVWDYSEPESKILQPRPEIAGTETNLALVLAGSAPLVEPWDGCGVPPWPHAKRIRREAEACEVEIGKAILRWSELLLMPADKAHEYLHADQQCSIEVLASLRWKVVRDLLPYLAGTDQQQTTAMLHRLEVREEGEVVADLSNFLLGRGWRSPDWERTERLWNLARDLLGVAENNQRFALLSILAWIEWARGRGSLAMVLLEQTLRECPDYNLARLLKELLNSGLMPNWATDQQRAWRAQFA